MSGLPWRLCGGGRQQFDDDVAATARPKCEAKSVSMGE
jgi:hypothetical protein